MKGLMIISLTIIAAFLFLPVMALGESQQTAAPPPLSQPLIREGNFATKLADVLKTGPVSNEAEAESSLTALGIAPKNGWVADYPVTPDVAAELKTSIGDAASEGRISVSKDVAIRAFDDVMASFDLTVSPGISNPVSNEASAAIYPDSEALYDYYYDEGPPVVTYYAPPPDYAYLYSWVPYPFWWSDFWFPGFFVLADFDVDFHGHHGHHHHGQGDREFLSNHFRDPSTGRMSRIDPSNRAHGGTFSERVHGLRGWASPSARASAESIASNSRPFASAHSGGAAFLPRTNGSVVGPTRSSVTGPQRGMMPSRVSRVYGNQSPAGRWSSAYGARTYAPVQNRTIQHSYRAYGNFSSSLGGRSFTAPSGGFRSFGAPSTGGISSGGGSFGGMRSSFNGGGRTGGSFGGRGGFRR